jgi:branched-chain amino acid transport system ATP-binding protein
MSTSNAMLLETRDLKAFYGDAQALFGIDFKLAEAEMVAIIGANGAGKSTFLKSITGLVSAEREAIRFKGEPIGGLPPGGSCAEVSRWCRRAGACSRASPSKKTC